MDKDRYELKGKSFIDNKTNQCLNFGLKDLVRVIVTLNSMDRWLEQDKEIIANLETKLAEKTLTIEQINKAFIENRSLWKGKYEQANQDKISFAIKQLEKAERTFVDIAWQDADFAIEIIDDQIKQLKEGK